MATVAMPHLGESVTEGTIGRWLKQPGERVEQYEPLVEVTTDKVNTEMPAPVGGVLQAITAPEGATVPVGAEIAVIAVEGEALPAPEPVTNQGGGEAAGPATGPAGSDESWTPVETGAPAPVAAARTNGTAATAVLDDAGGRRRFTPVVLRLAEQHEIPFDELARIPGTGLGGRVSKQ